MKTALNTLTAVVLLTGFAAFAHGDEKHLKGIVTKVEGMTLTLAIEKGEPLVVNLDEKTAFTRGAAKVTLRDLAVGDKAVIHAKEHDGKMIAHEVKLAAASKPTHPGADAGTATKTEKGHDNHPH